METTKKKIIRIIIFLVIGAILFQLLSIIFMPDWVDNIDVTLSLRGFYQEQENSIDVLMVGNSNVYRGVSPMILWKEHGITAYDYSSPMQKMWLSYYLIKEAYQYQKPKVILLDVDEVFYDTEAPEQSVRKVLDNLRLGKNKIEAMEDSIFHLSAFDKLTYVFPILRYHARWNQLKEKDFRRISLDYDATYKGYMPTKKVKPYSKRENGEKPKKTEHTDIIEGNSKKYLEKIIQLCKENGTELILMELPSPTTWSSEKKEAMTQYAKEHNLKFIDLNTNDQVRIDWNTDTEDGGFHLNRNGAEKVSRYLSEYLSETHRLPNHRNEEKYKNWNSDLEAYEKQP